MGEAPVNTAATTSKPDDTSLPPEEPWPAGMAFLTAWCRPATTARRTSAVPLKSAWLVHVLSALLVLPLISLLEGCDSHRDPLHLLGEILEEFVRDPGEAFLVLSITTIIVEMGFLAMALLLLPWGAVDEPIQASLRNALRSVWLHSTHALPVVLLVGLLMVWMSNVQREYYQSSRHETAAIYSQQWPTPPEVPASVPADAEAWRNYRLAQTAYQAELARLQQVQQQALLELRQRRPYLVRYDNQISGLSCLGAAGWIIWALLRAVGARRASASTQRPPMCETCGYNLVATTMEGRCPECGVPVVESLGLSARIGQPWEHGDVRGWGISYLTTVIPSLVRPRAFGQLIRFSPSNHRHRVLFGMHLAIAFLLGWVGIAVVLARMWGPRETWLTEVVWIVSALVCAVAAAVMYAVASLAVLAITLYHWAGLRRNLAGPGMQVVCCQSGYLVVWALLACANAWLLVEMGRTRQINNIGVLLNTPPDLIAFLVFAVPNVVLAAIWFILIWRATAGVRYANR